MILFLVFWEKESSLNEKSYMWSTFFILPQCTAPPTSKDRRAAMKDFSELIISCGTA